MLRKEEASSKGGIEQMELLDFALCLALLLRFRATGKEIRNFAKRARSKLVNQEHAYLADLVINATDRAAMIREFINNLTESKP